MKRLTALILAALFFCAALLPAAGEDAPPQISAQSAVLTDARDGRVLFEKNPSAPLPMASTTKIMTALVALDFTGTDTVVSVPAEAVGIEGSSAYLFAEEKMTVRDLLFALLLQSANDAAVTLAVTLAGSQDAFVARMNEKAAAFGMGSTHFENPHGLPAEGHVSTAQDLALLMRKALENPVFCAVTGAKSHQTEAQGNAPIHYFRNHNRLLSLYPACIGGKTGYTKAAGRCLVSAAQENGATLVCVTLAAPDDWNDHAALFDYGFSLYEATELAAPGQFSLSVPVVGGCEAAVTVTNTEALAPALPSGTEVTVRYELPHFVYAPVHGLNSLPENAPAPGEEFIAGYAVFTAGGTEIGRVKLYYMTSVAEYVPPTLIERILAFFGWKKSESRNS